MRIPIELPEPQADKLRGEAQRLGVRPQDLATAAVVDLLNRETSDFDSAATSRPFAVQPAPIVAWGHFTLTVHWPSSQGYTSSWW